jgi:hypothetical protein
MDGASSRESANSNTTLGQSTQGDLFLLPGSSQRLGKFSLHLLWFQTFVIVLIYEIIVCSLKSIFWERQVGQPDMLYYLLYVKMIILYDVC